MPSLFKKLRSAKRCRFHQAIALVSENLRVMGAFVKSDEKLIRSPLHLGAYTLVIGGNILEKPLLEIWRDSPEFNRIRAIRLRDLKKCGTCHLFQCCTRCPGLAQLEDGDVLGCSLVAKAVAKERKKAEIFPTEAHIFSKP